MNKNLVNTAELLAAALPYIKKYQEKYVVVKYGGNAMTGGEVNTSFARDIVLMKLVGINPIVVHGGGPQIAEVLNKIGKKSHFVAGMRVTDDETMEIVEMVLGGLVNKELVNLININGGRAIGLTGKDGKLLTAKKLALNYEESSATDVVDLGRVGEIATVDTNLLQFLKNGDFVPVIAPIGLGDDNKSYNINADLVAGKIAESVNAEKLILMTNIEGIKDGEGNLVSVADRILMEQLLKNKVISEGMIPKVNSALSAVENGVPRAHIIDGRLPHSLLLELFTDAGIGTLIER
ncbi:MAG: acetylglutamate kinase [Pseudomonadota bacterium]|nr:acetylglutamate kinase [Pseudomonadota bacterium]|tara:strand:- start:427 stop:1305 length:879 start_codon:yes stop_codon:yes gene_type:complete